MKPTLDISILLDTRSPNNVIITDNTNYAAIGINYLDTKINAKIWTPIGLLYTRSYYATPETTNDFGGILSKLDYAIKEGVAAQTSFMLDSKGCIVQGEYKVSLMWYNQNTNEKYEYTYSVQVGDVGVKPSITHMHDCLCATFTSADNANYGDSTENTYQHDINYPALTGETTLTTSLHSYADNKIAKGAYTTSVTTDRSYNIGVFIIRKITTSSHTTIVDCDSLCDIKCGIRTLYDKYMDACGSDKTLADKIYKDIQKITALYMLVYVGGSCGKDNSKYIQQIKDILGECACKCECEDCDEEDIWISNICNSSGGGVFDPTPIYTYINNAISVINNMITDLQGDINNLTNLITTLLNASWFYGLNTTCVTANGFPNAGTEVQKKQWILDFICLFYNLDFSCVSGATLLQDKLQDLIDKVCLLTNVQPQAVTDIATTTEDTCIDIAVVLNDNIQTPPYTIAISTPPLNGTAVLLPSNAIRYCPNIGYVGVDVLQYTITDGNGNTSTANVIITVVAAVAGGCIAPSPSFTASAARSGSTINVTITNTTNWNGGCPNTTAFTIVIRDAASNIVFQQNYVGNNNNTPITYAIPYLLGMLTVDVLMYVAPKDCGDGSPCSEVSLLQTSYAIGNLNNAPIANDDSYSTDIDTALVISNPLQGILANDSDPDGDSIVAIAGTFVTTGGGTIAINSNGTFTYTPLLGFLGIDSYTYTIQDPLGLTDTATIYIDVTAGGGGVDIDLIINDLQLCGEPSTNGKLTYILDATLTGADADSITGISTITVTTPTDPDQVLNYIPPHVLNGGFNLNTGLKADIMAGDGTIQFIVVAKDTSNNNHYYMVDALIPAIQFTNDCFTGIATNVVEFDPFA